MAGNLKWRMSCCTVHPPPLRKILNIRWIAFDFRVHIPHLVMLHWPVYQVIHKATIFDGPPKENGQQWVQAARQAVWFYDLADPVVCKVPWQIRIQDTHCGKLPWERHSTEPYDFGVKPCHFWPWLSILSLLSPAPCSEGMAGHSVAVRLYRIPSITEEAAISPHWKDIHSRYGLFPCMPSLKYSQRNFKLRKIPIIIKPGMSPTLYYSKCGYLLRSIVAQRRDSRTRMPGQEF